MSVLIVGGAGYIGSQTAKRAAEAGLEPVVLDNLVYGHRWAVKWGPLVEGDLADGDLITRVIKEPSWRWACTGTDCRVSSSASPSI